MDKSLSFAVVGGDLRQAYLAESLAADGHIVRTYALEKHIFSSAVSSSYNFQELKTPVDCIILPIPLSRDSCKLNTPLANDAYAIADTFTLFSSGQTVVGGQISNSLFEKASLSGVRLYDYLEREEFNALNAIPSAEGALCVAMNELSVTIHSTKSFICGFGRIGKLLAHMLRALGSDVTVSARKFGDLAWAKAYGYTTINTYDLSGKLSDFDIIFNTVPHQIFTRDLLTQFKKNCLYIDLASNPGGIDFEAAKELGIRALWELSLPGRFAPFTAANTMKNTIYNIINE